MSRYHYRSLRRLRNASHVPTDKITARFAKAKPYDRYIELTKSFVELRGSDPDSNNKAIPRILVSDARLIVDLYTKAWKRNIWKVIRAAHKERELERFQATIDQLKACKQDERDVYEHRFEFWQSIGRFSHFLVSTGMVMSSWDIAVWAVKDTAEDYAEAAQELAEDVADAGRRAINTATGAVSKAVKIAAVGAGLGAAALAYRALRPPER